MKKYVLFVSVMYVAGLSARYAAIESEAEFNRRLSDNNFSVACFADSESDQGKEINRAMRKASNREEFGKSLQDKVGFFFVRAERDKNHDLVQTHGYHGTPFCATFKRDYKTRSSTMDQDFSEQNIRHLLRKEFDDELEQITKKVEEEREQKSERYDDLSPRVHIGFGVGYQPLYRRWWSGSPYYGYGYGRRYYGGRTYRRGYSHRGYRRHRR